MIGAARRAAELKAGFLALRCRRYTLKGRRLVEHVFAMFAIALVAQVRSGLGELLGALAINGGASDGEGLGHTLLVR
jgi:hypothetical protein